MTIIWTSRAIRAIDSEPWHWFYGLVRDRGELHLGEVFPNEGWAHVTFGELSEREREMALQDCGL